MSFVSMFTFLLAGDCLTINYAPYCILKTKLSSRLRLEPISHPPPIPLQWTISSSPSRNHSRSLLYSLSTDSTQNWTPRSSSIAGSVTVAAITYQWQGAITLHWLLASIQLLILQLLPCNGFKCHNIHSRFHRDCFSYIQYDGGEAHRDRYCINIA